MVTFTIDGTPQKPVPLQVVNGHDQATFSLATLTAGTHKIAAIYEGDATFAASAVARSLVQTVTLSHNGGQTQAPSPLVTMESVQLVMNKKHRVRAVVIDFSGGVNPAQAQNKAEYRLIKAGKRGSFTAKHPRLIHLRSAVYNGTSDTVALVPRTPFALRKSVQLQVNGQPPLGLHDMLGRLIDGHHDGQPGGNAVAVLQKVHNHRHLVRGPLSLVGRGVVRKPGS
jgi:hypothetical protein